MDSKEAMRLACAEVGIKTVAESLGLSQSALYNQMNDAGRQDLLGKFVDFTAASESDLPIRWACEQLNGMFVRNPDLKVTADDRSRATDCISLSLREFSDVIREISDAMKDGRITRQEAENIRKEWEELKITLESFVLSCEFGFRGKA